MIQREIKCPHCRGTGKLKLNVHFVVICEECNGVRPVNAMSVFLVEVPGKGCKQTLYDQETPVYDADDDMIRARSWCECKGQENGGD